MFEDLKEIGKMDNSKRAVSFASAIVMEALVLGTIVIAPLIFFSVLPEGELLTFLIAPPPTPPAPPPPPRPGTPQQSGGVVITDKFAEPTAIPTAILPPPPTEESVFFVPGPTSNGILGSDTGTSTGINTRDSNLLALDLKATPAPPPPPKPKPVPVLTGGNVQESRLIRRVQPIYPQMARNARVQGAVLLEIEVDEEGNVVSVITKSGHPLLKLAAEDAVRQWKYRPALLNGEPTPVTSNVTVNFKLQ